MANVAENTASKTYYAVCDCNGPISVELSGDTEEEALASWAELDTRSAIDDAMTDAEDALDIDGDGMSDSDFTAALEEAGAEYVRPLGDIDQQGRSVAGDWCLWVHEITGDDEVTIVASISDGMSRNAGGQTTITADTMADAIEQAEEWCREGDYTTEDGGNVDVRLCIADPAGDIIEWRTVSCDAVVAS